ncbi:response regulator transcription factor [Candidatus Saccharibacteria bacterium oral taxon 488]|nr:response regulator transcription factor [Candidatus Saccharibacteria bacterium oral taxon 488]QLF51743.1 response regulator transcription factor [Candidatus Saccharibacteria bacterium oral taxon 488]
MTSTVLIVEDEPTLRTGTEQFLRQQGFMVLTATSGEEALEKYTKADVIILDIMLPKMSGIEVLRRIRQTSDVPVLMLTALHDEPTQVASFDELADDYMSKPFSLVLLEKRIRALFRRQQPTATLWRHGLASVDFAAYQGFYDDTDAHLKPKEVQLLKLLVDNPNMVWSRQAIIDKLWRDDEVPFDRVIDVYIKNLRKKLHLDCIVTVKGVGYRYEAA